MSMISLKDVDAALLKAIKQRALDNDTTAREVILETLRAEFLPDAKPPAPAKRGRKPAGN